MLIESVERTDAHWELRGPLGECVRLEPSTGSDNSYAIGTIGTRRRAGVKIKGSVTVALANRIADLHRPVILVDIRRTGAGGSGSWGPKEFATDIPGVIEQSNGEPYSFFHLPSAAPMLSLLKLWRAADKSGETLDSKGIANACNVIGTPDVDPVAYRHWQVFRQAYINELAAAAIHAGRAFVEHASSKNGIAIFLCAEELQPEFDRLDQACQDDSYCHRFTFAERIARSIREDHTDAEFEFVHLGIGESTDGRQAS